MPEWLQLTQVIVGTGFVVGTIVRGGGTWVLSHTIKRDLKDLQDEFRRGMKELQDDLSALKERVDRYNGSDLWGEVETKVGGIEVQQKLLAQTIGYLSDRITSLAKDVADDRNRHDTRRRP